MKKIRWGIIGCGDVTEIKSGPAFNKVKNSELVAVMRRNGEKAKDYALRHNVPKWYTNADALIHDPDVNAIYVATPPSSHEEYTLAAINAGKPVYVEKPMSTDALSASRMASAAKEKNVKLVVAHYRRAQPLFKKIRELLTEKIIGEIRFARCELYKPSLTLEELSVPKAAWRVNSLIAGGGLFHDLSPHQLDIMYYFFGDPMQAKGCAINQQKMYEADDLVAGTILFKNGVVFDGLWCFNISKQDEKDYCEIVGEKGKISFSFFEHKQIILTVNNRREEILFEPLQHVQQPMIEGVVEYFLDEGTNPCSGEDGIVVMKLIDDFTSVNKKQ
jgi:predicted dehydrogenase